MRRRELVEQLTTAVATATNQTMPDDAHIISAIRRALTASLPRGLSSATVDAYTLDVSIVRDGYLCAKHDPPRAVESGGHTHNVVESTFHHTKSLLDLATVPIEDGARYRVTFERIG